MNTHICEKMPKDAEIHEDMFEPGIWWYNKRLRTHDGAVGFGGTQIYFCSWCGINLEELSMNREEVLEIIEGQITPFEDNETGKDIEKAWKYIKENLK